MSSLQKHEKTQNLLGRSEDVIFQFENYLKSIQKISEVKKLMKKLKYLGLNFDPFSGEISQECLDVLKSLQLDHQTSDPYQTTNTILRLIDLTEEKLNQFNQ